MTSRPPERIAINHDDYKAEHVGHTKDGRQFFLTNPFVPADPPRDGGREFVALFLFDAEGNFLEALVDDFGPRATMDEEKWKKRYLQRLEELGEVTFDRIEVKPFSLRRFETEFGLIPNPPDEEFDSWTVELMPGNYMAFIEPWDSGVYDT